MFRKLFLPAMLAACALILATSIAPAFAQPIEVKPEWVEPRCGIAGTGLALQAGTTRPAAEPRDATMAAGFHRADGYWTRCFTWVQAGQPWDTPEPKPGKPCQQVGVITWHDQDTGMKCSQPKRGALVVQPNQLVLARTTTTDRLNGVATWRCDPAGSGRLVANGASCAKR